MRSQDQKKKAFVLFFIQKGEVFFTYGEVFFAYGKLAWSSLLRLKFSLVFFAYRGKSVWSCLLGVPAVRTVWVWSSLLTVPPPHVKKTNCK